MASKVYNERLRNLSMMRISAATEKIAAQMGFKVPGFSFRDRRPEQREAKTLNALAGFLESMAEVVPAEISETEETGAGPDRAMIAALLRGKSKAELAALVAEYGVEVSTSAKKETIIDALVSHAAGDPADELEAAGLEAELEALPLAETDQPEDAE